MKFIQLQQISFPETTNNPETEQHKMTKCDLMSFVNILLVIMFSFSSLWVHSVSVFHHCVSLCGHFYCHYGSFFLSLYYFIGFPGLFSHSCIFQLSPLTFKPDHFVQRRYSIHISTFLFLFRLKKQDITL